MEILKAHDAALNSVDFDQLTPSHFSAFHGRKDTLAWFELQTDVVINEVHLKILRDALVATRDPNFMKLQTEIAKSLRYHGTHLKDHLETQAWLLGECNSCHRHGATKKCSKCKDVYYCSQECQASDWKRGGHKQLCGQPPPKPAFKDSDFPCFYLKLDNETQTYLTVSSRYAITEYIPSAQDLLDLGIIKVEVDTSDGEKFIPDVVIYDEQHSKEDKAVAYIHRECIRHLCGEEGVLALEKFKRLGTSAWFLTGGPRGPTERKPLLHVTKQLL